MRGAKISDWNGPVGEQRMELIAPIRRNFGYASIPPRKSLSVMFLHQFLTNPRSDLEDHQQAPLTWKRQQG